MPKVLIIAYYFPPIGGSGIQRPLKFVKYLPQFGWCPYVLSTDTPFSCQGWDDTLVDDISGETPVWRITTPSPKPLFALKNLLGRGWKPKQRSSADKPDGSGIRELQAPSIWRRIARSLSFPLRIIEGPPIDGSLFWSLRVVRRGCRIIKDEQIDVILTTSPPWSSLVTGLLLHIMSRKPWVADMRDPWTTDRHRYVQTGWRAVIDRAIEKICFRSTAGVVSVTPSWVKEIAMQTGKPSSVHLITNGYDEDDFKDLPPLGQLPTDRMVLSHVGSLYRRSLEPLLEAMAALRPDLQDRLLLQLVGYVDPHDMEKLRSFEHQQCVQYFPDRVSHEEALGLMRNSHILLLLLSYDCYPAKIFEYMRIGRPVLAIGKTGDASELVRRAGIGCFVESDDTDRLIDILQQIGTDYQEFCREWYVPKRDVIERYDRKALTGRLREILESISSG